jgi:uncharacterized phage-like protein YoqJ
MTDPIQVAPMPERTTTIAFTGHRPQALGGFAPNLTHAWVRQTLASAIDAALECGFTTFISGMALGVDTWAAIEVLNRRGCGARLIAAVPFAGQESLWPAEARRVYDFILGEAELLHVVSDGAYAPAKMHVRDKWMVDHASGVIAVWDGRTNGGTFATVKYARTEGLPLLQIDPLQRRLVDMSEIPLLAPA